MWPGFGRVSVPECRTRVRVTGPPIRPIRRPPAGGRMSRRRNTGQIRFQYRSNAGKMRVETLKRPAATTARSKAEKSRWTAAASSVGGRARASAVKPTCRPSGRAWPSHQIRPSHETESFRPSRPSHQATSSELYAETLGLIRVVRCLIRRVGTRLCAMERAGGAKLTSHNLPAPYWSNKDRITVK